MDNKYIKRGSTSLRIKEAPIKTTLDRDVTYMKSSMKIKRLARCGVTETLTHCGWKYKVVPPL